MPNPQALQAYQNLLTQAGNVAATPFQAYGGEFVAPLNATQTAAGNLISQNAGFAQPYIQQAAGYANQAAQPITASQIAGFESPYIQQVVNATQAQFNNQNQQQLENVRGNAAAQGALGGDREAVAEGITSGQQQLAQAPVIAGLENQGYNTALSTALQEQQNLGQAAYSLGNLGVAGQNAALTGANSLLGYGTLGQSTQQAQDQALYQQFLAQQGYPFQTTQWLAGIDTGVGSQMGGTSSTTGPAPNPLSSILGLGALGLGAFNASDERVKEDISKVGKTHDGQNLYRYRYKGSPQWHIGLIAQEVEKRHPEAVAGFGGVKYVNLKEATEDAAKRREGGRIPGFQLGGTPYQSSASYIPSMGITMGSGPPKPPGTQGQGQQQTDPLKMASEAMSLEKGIASGGKGLGNLFGGSGDPSLDEVTQAGADAGLSSSELGFGAGGEDLLAGALLFRKGGGIPGFAGGGLADDAGFSDLGDAPVGGPIGTGMDPEFERRMAALNGLAKPADLPTTQGLGLGDIANTAAPGFENNYGIDDSRASWNEAIRQGGDRFQAGQQDAPSLAGVDASNYVNPSVVNGQKQNLTGEIIPPGGFGGGPAPELPPPQDVGDTRPRGLDVSAFAPTPGTVGAPSLPQGEGEKQSGFGGLGALFRGENPQLGRALMAAGFAMMASRSPFLANAVGEGGMAGLGAYAGMEKEARTVEEGRKKLEQHADEFAKKLALDTKKEQRASEHEQYLRDFARERLEQGKFTLMPGMGADENGNQVAGAYRFNTKTGEQTFQPGVNLTGKGGASAPLPAEAWTKHGDEFLNYVPPEKRNNIVGVAHYEVDPKSMWVTGGHREEAMNLAKQYDPTFDQKTYNERYNAINRFATGPQGNTVRSLNVAIEHLDTLDQLGKALNNGNAQVANQALNYLQRQFGDPRITNFNLAKEVVSDEVLKAVIGSGAGSVTDRENLQRQFSAANSPQQMAGVIGTAQALMAGQMRGLEQQYRGATGLSNFQERYLSPHTRERLNAASPAEGGSAGGAGGGLPRINSPAEAARLPRGSRFIDPNGVERVVP